jgi:hypothetical protein
VLTDAQREQVIRLNRRYLVEVVEQFGLCPWARSTRENGELAVSVVCGPAGKTARHGQFGDAGLPASVIDHACDDGARMLNDPHIKLAIVIIVDVNCDRIAHRDLRNLATKRVSTAGIADFHPDAGLDLTNPARLVASLRRAPDPFLQFVPFAMLDAVRGTPQTVDRAQQIALMLGQGSMVAAKLDIADAIAARNFERVNADAGAAFAAIVADIAHDRDTTYLRLGLL